MFFLYSLANFFLSRKRSSRAQRGRCKRHIRFIGNAVSYETKKNPILQDSPICFSIFFSGCYLFRNRLQEAVVPKIRDSRATTNESKYSLSALQPAARPAANIVKYPTPNQTKSPYKSGALCPSTASFIFHLHPCCLSCDASILSE